jgi:hypothetical protein
MSLLQSHAKSGLNAFLASGLQARNPGRRFFVTPCDVYYIDNSTDKRGYPEVVTESGGSITQSGGLERVMYEQTAGTAAGQNFYTRNRRDLYLWFKEPFTIDRPYFAPMVHIAWGDGTYLYRTGYFYPGIDVSRFYLNMSFIGEAYDPAFAYNDLPTFILDGYQAVAFKATAELRTTSNVDRTSFRNLGSLVNGGLTAVWTAGGTYLLAYAGVKIYGVRLRMSRLNGYGSEWGFWSNQRPAHIKFGLGEFSCTSPGESWKWPQNVWAAVWDDGAGNQI